MTQFNSLLAFYTATMKSQVGLANTLLGGARRLQLCQIEQINASSSDCGMLSDMVDDVQDFDGLQSTQGKLLDVQLERACAYWNSVATAMTTTNAELSETVQTWCNAATEDLCQAVDTVQCSEAPTAAFSNLLPLLDPSHYFAFAVRPNDEYSAVSVHNKSNGAAPTMNKAPTAKMRRGL